MKISDSRTRELIDLIFTADPISREVNISSSSQRYTLAIERAFSDGSYQVHYTIK